ncbi:MAG: translation initiation factor IF-2 [Patescibacteria group bacterium]|nr:translation initiation factor IF-2 [Patescibacteria group bacterium]
MSDVVVKTDIRPPVVVVMGHVDHGKSSILEAIREDFRITAKESGGITQHIGAYEVEHKGKKITFLDTPGHEAFSAMRARGAKIADIAVLVVAADDSVKSQTKEAIKSIQEAELPIVVAFNKIDLPGANVQKAKNELAQNDVLLEDVGGKVPYVETSATTKQGISELLDMILLVAEMEELKGSPIGLATGAVIESHLDSKRGPVATLLIRQGKLSVGDIIGTSFAVGKVRILEDFEGNSIPYAIPSMPVTVLGLETLAPVGEEFSVFDSLDEAKAVVKTKDKEQVVLDPKNETVNIVLKADVQGSLEAVQQALLSLPQDKISFKFIKTEAGDITENDVKLARNGSAMILGFHTKVSAFVASLAEQEKVRIETFDVIYELIERARKLLEGSIKEEIVRTNTGSLRILAIFRTDKGKQIIGGEVFRGEARKGAEVEIIRNEEMIGKGKITGLQRNKKESSSVPEGEEAGLLYEGGEKVEEGDVLEFYVKEVQKQEL